MRHNNRSLWNCCHSNETRAPIANPPDSAQLEGTAYHFPKLHPVRAVGMRRGTDRHTDTQTAVANIRFASATPHAKCSDLEYHSNWWEMVLFIGCISFSLVVCNNHISVCAEYFTDIATFCECDWAILTFHYDSKVIVNVWFPFLVRASQLTYAILSEILYLDNLK